MDTETQAALDNQSPAMKAAKAKKPRHKKQGPMPIGKPKPKKAKAKRKPAKKTKKPAAKKKAKVAKRKPVRGTKLALRKLAGTPPVRSERLDLRLSKAEKARIVAKAKKLRRTVTSIVIQAIEKIK